MSGMSGRLTLFLPCPATDFGKYGILNRFGESDVRTDFLERRELQLLMEAAKHSPNSQATRHLLHLANRLWQATVQLEAPAGPAPGMPHIANPWHDCAEPIEPHGIEFFHKAMP